MRFPWDRQVDESNLPAHWFGRMLTALYFSTFMIRASFAIMLISFPIYILGLKSYFLFGLVVSSSPIFELITVLGLGAYIDKHGRKNVLLLGLLTGSVALFGLLTTKDPVLLFVINAFHGMSAAAILVSSLALIADYAPKKSRGKIMGAFDFVNLFGWIVGFGVGGLLIDAFKDNIGMTFVVAGTMGLVAWVWATFNVLEPDRSGHLTSDISLRAVASVIKQRSVILLIAPWFIIYLLVSTLLTFTSKAGTQELGLTGRDLALLLGGGGTLFLVTQVVYGQLSDKYGRTKIMIVGTVGIVGIMLTVGSVFLAAPAAVAPQAHTLIVFQGSASAPGEFLLQSPLGVYFVDENASVSRELSPPEGGFGTVTLVRPVVGSGELVSVTKNAVQLISLETGAVVWVEPAHAPTAAAGYDVNGDGKAEVFYADAGGLHLSGPAVPPGLPSLPPLGEGERVADLAWGPNGASLVVLLSTAGGATVALSNATGLYRADLGPGFTALLKGSFEGPPAALGSGAVSIPFQPEAGRELAIPANWSAEWVPGATALSIVAFPPYGGAALFFEGASPESPSLLTLAGGFATSAWAQEGLATLAFVGYAPDGTLSHTTVSLGGGPSVASSSNHTVLVKRESAQATFAKLTSPALLVPLGIFALMAGAFGPAALAGLTDVSQSDKRGVTMGLYSVVISSSMIVGPITTGFLVDNYGGFGVMVFLVLSAAAMALFMAIRAWDVRRAGGDERVFDGAAKDAADAAKEASRDPAAPEGALDEE